MEIYRFGKKIILTEQELFLAYEEQESIYDMENVRENMGTYLTAEQYVKLKGNKSFIEEAAFLLRTYLDKNNMTYEYAIAEAIKDAAESVKTEEERQDD
ncbi:hypothetical protein D3Z53_01485 [Lachnospiraceae bacterium]|jgi:hypothetical protein|nr:hypothetical protein [uncultured Schaedlerella sp.]NBI56763.1 hypothetical protein [Lachnospiraceae bacterium]